ncbi:MAG: hypothetical protein C4K47_06320 [Candidatus Thorarchaeota archaeon]|nr:MAG: hypothetical protein C4K47_06320 [Candidatus Thorarchaeota archaeon]
MGRKEERAHVASSASTSSSVGPRSVGDSGSSTCVLLEVLWEDSLGELLIDIHLEKYAWAIASVVIGTLRDTALRVLFVILT